MIRGVWQSQSFDVPCTIELEHTPASLHAWVELDGNPEIRPGDEVLLHDAPTQIAFGERVTVRRHATVTRAGWAKRLWTKLTAYHELTELFEVNFSPARKL